MQKATIGKSLQRGGLFALAMTGLITAGCGGGGGSGGGTSAANSAGNSAPKISGTPATQASVGAAYSMAPQVADPDGDALAFSIQNKPSWAEFNTTTGQLTGTPNEQATAANILITVSDGKTSVSLPAFSITVGAPGSTPAAPSDAVPSGPGVELSWNVPTQTEDGGTLQNLAGYRIHYGPNENTLVNSVEVASAGLNRFTVQNVPRGTYFFAVRAITADGDQSKLSNVISRVIG